MPERKKKNKTARFDSLYEPLEYFLWVNGTEDKVSLGMISQNPPPPPLSWCPGAAVRDCDAALSHNDETIAMRRCAIVLSRE